MFTVTAEELWKGVLAESGAGARKGRGKRTKRKLRRDLNRGQSIGEGKTVSQCLCPSGIRLSFFELLQMFLYLSSVKLGFSLC